MLLSRLDHVKRTGSGRWLARCPAHADKSPSLSVREMDDGRILLHDFAGCEVEEILAAVDLTFDDLFPPRPPRTEGERAERRPFLPTDIFDIARHELAVVAIVASDMHKDRAVNESDYERLYVAVERLNDIAETAYGK